MALTREQLSRILYPASDGVRGRRFTQDTPILPEVWAAYAAEPGGEHELLLTPHQDSSIAGLIAALHARLRPGCVPPIYNESHVLVLLSYRDLIRLVLPLSVWWRHHIVDAGGAVPMALLRALPLRPDLPELLLDPARQDPGGDYSGHLLHLVRVAGAVALAEPLPDDPSARHTYLAEAVRQVISLLEGLPSQPDTTASPLWSVSCNRRARGALCESRLAVKADAAIRLFDISCEGIRWAVLDSGVDARHPAFLRPNAPPTSDPSQTSRVVRTYDFTRFKDLLYRRFAPAARRHPSHFDALPEADRLEIQRDLRRRLQQGRPLDWKLLEPYLAAPHGPLYSPPDNEHGTHVAGILAADWNRSDAPPITGICPDLELYDFRVIDASGCGDEFSILAALQFVRHLNSSRDRILLDGVNLSFSLPHAVDSYACGATPICLEAERLVSSGVVVVAAAGNGGYAGSTGGAPGLYHNISITDPGNAESVITVGSTHRGMAHTYGVSYFSSRGPTGDGRLKPDLVAPGEKIESAVPGGRSVVLDGTSMAAPHVSGAAALLMARHRELIGQPRRIKDILCRTATDLGRERTFQGAGLLDILRALQSV